MSHQIDNLVEWIKHFDFTSLEQNEDDIETKFIIPLFQNYLDYPENCRRGKYPISAYSPGRSGKKPEVDQVFFSSNEANKQNEDTSLILVEAKRQGESLEKARKQAKFYCYHLKAIFYVLIDGSKIFAYKHLGVREDELLFESVIKELSHRDKAKELFELLNFETVKKIKELLIDEITHAQYVILSKALSENPDFREILEKGDFKSKEEIIGKHFMKTTPRVAIKGDLPEALNEGKCEIRFSDPMLHGLMVQLNHQEILHFLLLGLETPFMLNMRRFIQRKGDVYEAKLGQTVLALNETNATDLCKCVDFVSRKYKQVITDTENLLKTRSFHPVKVDNEIVGVRLVSVRTWLWRLMHAFSMEFDFQNGDSDWHIFQQASIGLIQMHLGMWLRVQLWAVADEHILGSQEINIVYRPVNPIDDNWANEVGERGIWTAEYTRNWLLSKFIPKVYSYYHLAYSSKNVGRTNSLLKRVRGFISGDPFFSFPEFFKRSVEDWRKPDLFASFQGQNSPEVLKEFVQDIQIWAHFYPLDRIPTKLLKEYYASFAALAAEIWFDFSEDRYVASNLLAIDSRLARNNQPFFYVGGFEQIKTFSEQTALFDRNTILDCLTWQAHRIVNCDFEYQVVADWLTRVYLHILDSEHLESVSQASINKFKEALLPLWEHCRFEKKYIFDVPF